MGRSDFIVLSIILALAVALATYFIMAGLPPDTKIALWTSGPQWSLSRSAAYGGTFLPSLVTFLLVIAGSVSVCLAIASTWNGLRLALVRTWSGLGSLADILAFILAPELNLDQHSRLGTALQTLISLLLVVSIGSALLRTALVIQALLVVALGLAAVFAVRAALYRMREMRERLTLHSRSSPIGGGLAEWRISPPLAMILLAVALIGGTIAVATVGTRPETPVTTKPEAKPEAGRAVKPSDETSTEAAHAPGAAPPADNRTVPQPTEPGAK